MAGAPQAVRATGAFFSVSCASWTSATLPSNASSLSRVDTVEWKPCAQWSPPNRSPCPQRLVGTPSNVQQIADERRTISSSASVSRQAQPSSPPKSFSTSKCLAWHKPLPRPRETGVRLRVCSIPVGRFWRPERHLARLAPRSLLFLPANTARYLVGISVGIGRHLRLKHLRIQIVMGLGGYRPGAPLNSSPLLNDALKALRRRDFLHFRRLTATHCYPLLLLGM